MNYSYKTRGTCSTEISFELDENNLIHNVIFKGGCNGNLKAISMLCEGKKAEEIATLLEGNTCGPRPTSCADQFSKALKEALEKNL